MKVCKKCGNEFEPKKGLISYCSLKCRNSRVNSGPKNKRKERKCTYCGQLTKNPKYCSNECQGNHKSEQNFSRVEQGLVTTNAVLRKYLTYTRGSRCESCGQGSKWNNKKLVLQVDHIDGNSDNNFPSNIRLLCPNCHSQTPTYNKNSGFETKRKLYLKGYRKNAPVP